MTEKRCRQRNVFLPPRSAGLLRSSRSRGSAGRSQVGFPAGRAAQRRGAAAGSCSPRLKGRRGDGAAVLRWRALEPSGRGALSRLKPRQEVARPWGRRQDGPGGIGMWGPACGPAGPRHSAQPSGEARWLRGLPPPPGPLPSPSPRSAKRCPRPARGARPPRGTPAPSALPAAGMRSPLTRKPFSRSALISASSCFRAAVKPRKSRYSRTSSSVRSAAAAMGAPRRRRHRPPTAGAGRGWSGPDQPQAGLQLPACLARLFPAPLSIPLARAARVFPAFWLVAAGRWLRADWPAATCGSCCSARAVEARWRWGRGAVIDGRGVIDRRSERAIPEAPGAAPHRLPPAGPRLPTSDGAAGAGTLTSGLCLRSVARQGALIQWKAGKGFPGGRLRLWRAWLGLDLALSCKSMSGIVAHTNVLQFIGKKKILCCKEACHLAPSVGAKES